MWREDVKPVPVMMGRLVSISQAGAILDLSERQVRRLVDRGYLAPVKIGRRLYVTRSSVMAHGMAKKHFDGDCR